MISKHTIAAEIVTPDTVEDEGRYVDTWETLAAPRVLVDEAYTYSEETGEYEDLLNWTRPPDSDPWPGSLGGSAAEDGWGFLGTRPVNTPQVGMFSLYRDHVGLVAGTTYRLSVRVSRGYYGGPCTADVGVEGIGYGAPASIPTPETPWQTITCTFTATATTHRVRLRANFTLLDDGNLMFFDDYRLSQLTTVVPVWDPSPVAHAGQRIPLDVVDASITLDESWSPYAQATLVCKTPEPSVLAQIDPRDGVRVFARLTQAFGEGSPLSEYTARLGGSAAAWTAAYGNKTLLAASQDFGIGYNAGGVRGSTRRSFNLSLVTRDVDLEAGTMTLTAMSDEIVAQGVDSGEVVPVAPAGTSLVDTINFALRRLNATLVETVADVTDLTPDALAWSPGVSVWEYLAPLVLAGERRLWCDELGAWRLGYVQAPGAGELRAAPILTAGTDRLDTEAWFDAVLVEYRWTDGSGVEQTRYERAGETLARRVYKVIRDGRPWPRSGAARALLRYVASQGRSLRLEAVSDYHAGPRQSFTFTLPDDVVVTGVVASVTWSLPTDRMTVTTRDLLEAPEHSWLADTPGVSWDDVPAGIDWTEDV
ncbi:hypothetical protein CWIS_09745 [Cellulomonas sp. A375-1]|uniref:hypothetical protein n=1 Tax=Cellulomonas sp. A375-1 TaxID=1672219 RepID=UPI0006526CB6|nr:hypothetical protein [Cellulomonas sp. A375-1]KMM45613.1 hypothetical protein CWIS_09745 [Cellulomonas sp. A375-1]